MSEATKAPTSRWKSLGRHCPRWMPTVWMLVALGASLAKLRPDRHNNFTIFRSSWLHLSELRPLYTLYPRSTWIYTYMARRSLQEIAVSSQGLERILDILEKEGVVATFYSTARYMREMPTALRQRLLAGGHEIASHGVEHSAHTPQDYDRSRQMLRALTGQSIYGFRMARMQPVDYTALVDAGYSYDSSLHPTYLRRYNNLSKSRLPHQYLGALWRLPASVTPMIHFPLFWLSMHNLPLGLYVWMMKQTHKADGYLNVYYHPWEFADLSPWQGLLPSYILRNSGLILAERLSYLIQRLKEDGAEFGRTIDYLENIKRININ